MFSLWLLASGVSRFLSIGGSKGAQRLGRASGHHHALGILRGVATLLSNLALDPVVCYVEAIRQLDGRLPAKLL